MILKINTYGQKIRGIAYEIRSLDDSRLVAKGDAQEIKEKNNEISANLKIQNILGKGEEYELIVILASGKNKIRYYTRLMQTQNDDTQACLDFALQFHEYSFPIRIRAAVPRCYFLHKTGRWEGLPPSSPLSYLYYPDWL